MNSMEVKVPVTVLKAALKFQKIRAIQVLYALKYCLGTDSRGHVDLRPETITWLSQISKVSERSIRRDIQWLISSRLLKQDSDGHRVVSTSRMHWHLLDLYDLNQVTALQSTSKEGAYASTKQRVGTRVHSFKLLLNFIITKPSTLKKIFTTLIVAKNLRSQAFRQYQELAQAGRVPKKWRDVQMFLDQGQSLTGESLAEILKVSVRKAYALRQHAHVYRRARIYQVEGCRDADVLLTLGREHFQVSGGIVYPKANGSLVFRTSDLLVADYTGAMASDRSVPHWISSKFELGGNMFEKGHFNPQLSRDMNFRPIECKLDFGKMDVHPF